MSTTPSITGTTVHNGNRWLVPYSRNSAHCAPVASVGNATPNRRYPVNRLLSDQRTLDAVVTLADVGER